MITRRLAALGLAAAATALPRSALAAFPERPVRLIVPFGAGGNLDTLMRLAAPGLSARLGQPVVVENRPGAGGNVGAEAVARAAPDGYTVLVGSNGGLVTNPLLMARMPYDPARDFAPVGLAFRTPNVLVVGSRSPARTLAEFVAHAKARPGQVTVGSAGTGTTTHLLIELLSAATGTQLVHVPYRASGAGTPDLLAGTLGASLDQITTALPQHRAGELRIIGIGLDRRAPLLPEVPTFAEVGIEDGGLVSFIGLLAPAGTPADAIGRLQAALAGTLADPALRERVESLGNIVATPEQATPAGFAALIRREAELSRRAVQLAGLKPE
jgi:tripartite-type tricarboxylate transporter receptor subunit TctC